MKDFTSYCQSKPSESACSLWRACSADGDMAKSPFCGPWSLLHSACSQPFTRPPVEEALDCRSFHDLCGPEKTAVRQCFNARYAGVPGLISASNASLAVAGLCTMMPDMAECDACTAKSCNDPLMSLGRICSSMSMEGCEAWEAMCAAAPKGSLGEICGVYAGPGTCSGVMQVVSPIPSEHPESR